MKPNLKDLARIVKIKHRRIVYLKTKGDKRIVFYENGKLDLLKSIMFFAISPDDKNYKTCKICRIYKKITEFQEGTLICKKCYSAAGKTKSRRKTINKGKIFWPDHKPGVCVHCGATYKEKKFTKRHGEYQKQCNKCRWKYADKKTCYKRQLIKQKTDPKTKINKLMSNGIRRTFKANNIDKSRRSWITFVDFSPDELLKHLKNSLRKLNKNSDIKYTWQDFMEAKLHIDHIIPITRFNYNSPNDPHFKRCWSLGNLQLLPAFDNISKSNKCESFQMGF